MVPEIQDGGVMVIPATVSVGPYPCMTGQLRITRRKSFVCLDMGALLLPTMAAIIHQDMKTQLLPDYISLPECSITANMRNVNVNVLDSFHSLFNLSKPTLYVAVNIFDRARGDLRIMKIHLLKLAGVSLSYSKITRPFEVSALLSKAVVLF